MMDAAQLDLRPHVAESGQGPRTASVSFCRHCGKDTNSATELLDVGGSRYEVMYCSECGIAGSAFRLSREGRREGPADTLMLRRLHKPAKK